MALWTRELVTYAGEVNYKEELDEERMCYMFATNDTRAAEFPLCHYIFVCEGVYELRGKLSHLSGCLQWNE